MSASQYPEHLNPFAEEKKHKTGLRLRDSFREFSRTLRKSFRRKPRHEEVEIRQRIDVPRPVTFATTNTLSPALPRSRFHERLAKSQRYSDTSGTNPFEEDEKPEIKEEITDTISRRKKRGKKKAPPPPMSQSSQDVTNLHTAENASAWSLTSADSDFSCSTDNISASTKIDDDRLSLADEFLDFRREIEKLNEDSNNNDTKEADKEEKDMPDLVISCPDSDPEMKKVEEDKCDKNGNEESDDEVVVKDITGNLRNPDEDNNNSSSEILFNERKSLYIAGSRDELNESSDNYMGRVSLYITGSANDICDNNNSISHEDVDSIKEETASEVGDGETPIPKQRRNKYTKNSLLGMSS